MITDHDPSSSVLHPCNLWFTSVPSFLLSVWSVEIDGNRIVFVAAVTRELQKTDDLFATIALDLQFVVFVYCVGQCSLTAEERTFVIASPFLRGFW